MSEASPIVAVAALAVFLVCIAALDQRPSERLISDFASTMTTVAEQPVNVIRNLKEVTR